MTTSNKTIAALVGGAFVASLAGSVVAAENPFAVKTLSKGYMVAEAEKMKDGKCGTGKCSASMKKSKEGKCSAEKAKEGSCSAEKAKEGSCSAEKAKEGSCHAKTKEGSCNH